MYVALKRWSLYLLIFTIGREISTLLEIRVSLNSNFNTFIYTLSRDELIIC
jgi:hypothetical protein